MILKKIRILIAVVFILPLFSCYEGLGGLAEEQPSPPVPPARPSLYCTTDTDRDEDQVCFVLTLVEPDMEDDINSYRIYWGTADEKLNLICEFSKGTASLEYSFSENTPVPTGATHFIAQSVTADGRVSESAVLDIEDIVIQRVSDMKAGESSIFLPVSEFYIVEYNGYLYFNGGDKLEGNGAELWRYDGVNPPAEFININPSGSSYPDHFCVYNNRLYFSADGGDGYGKELWCYDGSTITRVTDINTSGDSLPSFLKIYNNNLYFVAESSWSRKKLYRYDGSGDPVKVCDINSAGASDDICCLAVFNGKLYFQATNGSTGRELWSFDGSSPVQVADINSSIFTPFSPHYLCVYNEELYFSAEGEDLSHGAELWVYNGSADPYEKFDVYPGYLASTPKYMTVYNGNLFFQAYFTGKGAELCCYDGVNSPHILADIDNTSTSTYPECLTVFNGKHYFYVKDTASKGLWVFYIK
jgi:ELWxxDGT repeat protein